MSDAWLKGKYFYSATAIVYVAPRVANILQDDKEQEIPSFQQYRQFITQQIATINRYDIMLAALERLGEKRYLWQQQDESARRAAERLQSSLIIKGIPDSYSIKVALELPRAEGLNDIVNAVVESYIKTAHEEQLIYASKERVDILYKERDKLQGFIADKKTQLAKLAQELSVTIFVDNIPNPYDQLLANSQLAYSEAQRDRMAAEADLHLFENNKDTQASTALEVFVADIIYKDAGLNSLKANMYQRRSKLVELISGLDVNHPGHAQIKKQLEVIEAEVVEATNQLSQDMKFMILESRRAKVTLTTRIEADLLNQITSEKKNAAWFLTHYNNALTLNQEIKQIYDQLETVEKRIGFFELESQAPGFIRIESLARPPEIPIRGGRKKLIKAMILLGLISGLAIPILIDLLDRRIKTAGQVEKLLGYKPLAAFMASDKDNALTEINADKKRRLALALAREHKQSGKASSFILLTSVNHQSGVTALAMDMAMAFKNMDEHAVVVEINPLAHDQRYVSEHTRLGLLDLALKPELLVSQVVSPADQNYPARIAIGVLTENFLCGHLRLQAALEKIAQTYPLVILDAAPVLFAADTEFFIGISDISLLLIAAQQTKPAELKQAVQLMERISPHLVSFVVTRLEDFKAGGYFGALIKADGSVLKMGVKLWASFFKKKS